MNNKYGIFETYFKRTTHLFPLDDPVKRILWAAESGNLQILEEMLMQDAGLVNARDSDGYTPLHRAAYEGHTQIVEVK